MKNNVQLLLEHALSPLTQEKEQGLFRRLELIKKRLRKNKKFSLTLQHEKYEVVTIFIRANIPLVVSVAKKQHCPGVSLEEFITEGLSKSLKCVHTFDYRRGSRFSTYLYCSLMRMYGGFIRLERQRNMGKIGDENEFFQYNYLTNDPVDSGLCDLWIVIQENRANLTDIELFLIKHNYGIGEEPKTMNQLKLLIGGKLSSGRLQQIMTEAIEKLRSVLTGEKNEDETKRSIPKS